MSEIGRLWVTVGAKTDELQRGLSQAQQRLGNASVQLGRFGASMTRNVTLPLVAVGAGMLALAKRTGTFADELLDLSAATGISTDNLQRYRAVAASAGTATDAVATSIAYMTRQMTDSNTFGARATKIAEEYGVALHDVAGGVRAVEDVHWDLMLAIAAIEDPQQRAIAGVQAFGRQWEQLAPIVDLGTEALERLAAQEVISRERLEKANEFRQVWDEMGHTFSMIAMDAGIELINMLNELFDLSPENLRVQMDKLRDGIFGVVETAGKWIGKWQELDDGTKKLYGGIAILIPLLGPVSSGLTGVLKLVSAAAGIAKVSVGLLLGKVTLAIGAVIMLIELWKGFKKLEAMDQGGRDALQGAANQMSGAGGSMLRFDTGGVVPGPLGAPQMAVVHGGETILPTHKSNNIEGLLREVVRAIRELDLNVDVNVAGSGEQDFGRKAFQRGLAGGYR